jgi:hypothetical protein
MTPIALTPEIADVDAVRRWRLEELIRAGYESRDALVLSGEPRVDLHAAVELLAKGCSTETALRIPL